MSEGKRIVEGPIREIIATFGGIEYSIKFDRLCSGLENVESCDDCYQITTSKVEDVNLITRRIIESGGNIIEIRTEEPSLEEIFLRLVE